MSQNVFSTCTVGHKMGKQLGKLLLHVYLSKVIGPPLMLSPAVLQTCIYIYSTPSQKRLII